MTDEIISPVDTPEVSAPENSAPVSTPKRRGRPPKNPPADGNPQPVGEKLNTSGARRGRPKNKVSYSDGDISELGKQITGLHQLAALATGIPELVISEKEGQVLGAAMANVAQEYGLSLDGKTGALLQLVAACGMVYVPKYFQLRGRIAQVKAQREQEGVTLHVVGGHETPAH
jgi:hypothetical protein